MQIYRPVSSITYSKNVSAIKKCLFIGIKAKSYNTIFVTGWSKTDYEEKIVVIINGWHGDKNDCNTIMIMKKYSSCRNRFDCMLIYNAKDRDKCQFNKFPKRKRYNVLKIKMGTYYNLRR